MSPRAHTTTSLKAVVQRRGPALKANVYRELGVISHEIADKVWARLRDTRKFVKHLDAFAKVAGTPDSIQHLKDAYRINVVDLTDGRIPLRDVLAAVVEVFDTLAHACPLVKTALESYSLQTVTLESGPNLTVGGDHPSAIANWRPDQSDLYIVADRAVGLLSGPLELGVGAHNVSVGFRSVLTHEVAHVCQVKIEEATDIIWAIEFDKHPPAYWEQEISAYAGHDSKECFAEAFTAWTHPDYLTCGHVLPQEMVAIMEAVGVAPAVRKGYFCKYEDDQARDPDGRFASDSNASPNPIYSEEAVAATKDLGLSRIDVQREGVRESIKLSTLVSPQSGVNTKKVERLVASFDPDAMTELYVLRIAGMNILWEGNHRVSAALKLGIKELPARVLTVARKLAKAAGDVTTSTGRVISAAEVAAILQAAEEADWALIEGVVTPELIDAFKAAGYQELVDIGASGGESRDVFDVLDREAVSYAQERGAELVTQLQDTTRDRLRNTVVDALQEGWSKPELVDELTANFAFSEYRAEMIAHTEIAMAHSYGRVSTGKEAGATKKKWLLSADHNPEEDCYCSDAAEAGWVDIDDNFVDDDDYDFPPGHPNCWCDWITNLNGEDEEEGDNAPDSGADDSGDVGVEDDAQAAGKLAKGDLDADAHLAATSHHSCCPPTEAQLKAGNYRMGHIQVGGLDVAVENPAGTRRRTYYPVIRAHYGYINRTEGADGDHVDVFVKPGTDEEYCGPVYVINQPTADGVTFDEHKCMIGWGSQQGAVRTYLSAYQAGWKLGTVVRLTWDQFTDWVAHGNTKVPLLVPVK